MYFVKGKSGPRRIEHLAEHDVTPDEFEEIVSDPEYEDVSRSSGNPLAIGYTNEGRHLCCVFRLLDEDTIEPVTAYEVND
jgi:uncharacterized DUF497 family protein